MLLVSYGTGLVKVPAHNSILLLAVSSGPGLPVRREETTIDLAKRRSVEVPSRPVSSAWPPTRDQATGSDHPLSVSNNDLGSSDCRTILNSVPRPTAS